MTNISTQYAMAAFASSLFIYTLLKLVYRIFFHPLRRFPGPTLAACTKYYRGYHDIVQNGGWLEQLDKLHRLYGPVVRVAPNQLDFSGSKAYDDIISKPYPKDHEYYEVLGKPNADALVTTCDPKEASGRRLAIGAYLSRKAVFRLEHDVEEKVDTLVHRLSSHVSSEQPVDLTYAFRAASLDIITSYLFAQRFNSLDYPNFQHPMILSLEKVTRNIWYPKYIPISFDKLPEWIVRKLVPAAIPMLDQQKHLNRQFFELVQSDAPDEPKRAPAIFDVFLRKGPEGKKTWTIPRARLLDECTSLQVAGTDTVANACTIGTYHLLRNPQILVNLQRELDQTWPDRDSPMNLGQLEKLPYLTSVIKESLRLSHGVVDPLPHVVNRPDATVMGIPVPIGVSSDFNAPVARSSQRLINATL
ncbi:hypothetical protein PQX77_010102 [Marasmius sp. AFHP31]|nr:hypothetical protein PQX77_010102 [Marasmius sp. AFHP31]